MHMSRSLKVTIVLTLKWWDRIFKSVFTVKLDSPEEPESNFILLLCAAGEISSSLFFIIHRWTSCCLPPPLAVDWKNFGRFRSRSHRRNFLFIPAGYATHELLHLQLLLSVDSTNAAIKQSKKTQNINWNKRIILTSYIRAENKFCFRRTFQTTWNRFNNQPWIS